MQFFAFKDDLNPAPFNRSNGKDFAIDSSTSVSQQKKHLLEAIGSFAEITPVDERISKEEFTSICRKPGAIFLEIHVPAFFDMVPRRAVLHSLGDFMLPFSFFDPRYYMPNTVNIVTTKFQEQRLKKYLKEAAPPMAVFTPSLDENNFYPPSFKEKLSARKKFALSAKDIHIVYAGRWLATKGICQLLRILKLWPRRNVQVSFVGGFELDFRILSCNGTHFGFDSYFKREIADAGSFCKINLFDSRKPNKLRELFWSADLFAYPSGHEDENFGMAPREAVLCGLPVVVTDFCGLRLVGQAMPWKSIPTYPTVNGPRYSLRQFNEKISQALASDWDKSQAISRVKNECDKSISLANIKKAAQKLASMPLKDYPEQSDMRKEILFKLFQYADPGFIEAFTKKAESAKGIFTKGMGVYREQCDQYSLLKTIQGFYTTSNAAPLIKAGDKLRGFFRTGLYKEEKAFVEFGFPGPRFNRYNDKDWKNLVACVEIKAGEMVVCPRDNDQIRLAQELVDLGYLVPDR